MDLHGLGAFLAGASVLAAIAFAGGFVAGYMAGQEGPVFNLELENSTVSFCAPSGSYYPDKNASIPPCPEVPQ